jgi:hypothetical protein
MAKIVSQMKTRHETSVMKTRHDVKVAAAPLKTRHDTRVSDEMSTGAGKALRLKNLAIAPPGLERITLEYALKKRDLATAGELKGAINDVLKLVRFGQPIPDKDEPRPGPNGRYVAPNGDPLIRVKLSGSNGIPGSSEYALVNPKTNEFYKEQNEGGFMHPTNYYGPMSLPKGTRFVSKSFTEGDLKKLEKAANSVLSGPIKKGALAALEAHLKAGDLNFDHQAPNPKDILKSTVIKSEHPFTYTAIVLKGDPNHVIIKKVLTGGFVPAGPNDGSYSQPISVN